MALRTLDQLKDELDDLLGDYLEALSHYQQARILLADHLKAAHFDLARAKLALGPGRVGPAKYDLTENAAQKGVTVAPIRSSADRSDPAGRDAPTLSSWTYSFDDLPVAPVEASQGGESTSTRQRRRRATELTVGDPSENDGTAVGTADEKDAAVAVPPPPASRRANRPSPLAQFSALPPPSLRAAATGFTRATDAAVQVVDAEARVRECARRVKRARKEVDRWIKEEAVQL